jgi:L-amino acid N-acyltransferase YncA
VVEANGRVAGFAATSPYSRVEAYAGIAECSVYVDPELRGRGLGTELLNALAAEACGSSLAAGFGSSGGTSGMVGWTASGAT